MISALQEAWSYLANDLFLDGFLALLVASLVLPPLGTVLALRRMPFVTIAVPALAVYGPELFGTHDRSRANALIVTVGVAGSAIGLFGVGVLSDAWGNLGAPLAVAGIAPVIVAGLVLTRFPETAGLDLEQLNPEDA